MSEKTSNAREFFVATAIALFLGIVLSISAVYGLNRFLDEHDEAPTVFAGAIRGP